jgi:hypothetical protein
LKADWWQDFEAWQKRDLSNRRFLYIWADGVYFEPRVAVADCGECRLRRHGRSLTFYHETACFSNGVTGSQFAIFPPIRPQAEKY